MPQKPGPPPRHVRFVRSVRLVPLVLALIGAAVLAYGLWAGAETPQTLGAALIAIGLVAQLSAMMRGR